MLALRILFIIGFCVTTIGAAGFSKEIEPLAWPFYVGGLVVTLLSGVVLRRKKKEATAAAAAGSASFGALVAEVGGIRDELVELERDAREPDEQQTRLEALLTRCALLGQRNEEFLGALGFERYAQVWDGFATAERLLARAWSMTADGFPDEGRRELPRARAALERAAAAS